MRIQNTHSVKIESVVFTDKLKAYFDLTKFRLSSLVVFSTVIGYLLAHKAPIDYNNLMFLCIGGFLVTTAANTFNQVIEINLDKLMTRTMDRPLPTGTLSKSEALIFAIISGIIGLSILAINFNVLVMILSLVSLILYAFVYTPLKQKSSIAVLVGAIPGALPPLLGWVALTGDISAEAICLFGIQFFWQFPHFWAIAWVLDEDYSKAGFKLLPNGGKKDINTAFQIMIYTLILIPVSLLPLKLGLTGVNSAMIALVCGVLFLALTFYLMKTCSKKAALRIMFGSFLYLPIVQIAFIIDKV